MSLLQDLALPMVYGFVDELWKDTFLTQTLKGWLEKGYRVVISVDGKNERYMYPPLRSPLTIVRGDRVIDPGSMLASREKWHELNYCVMGFPINWFVDPSRDSCEGKEKAISIVKTFLEKADTSAKSMLLLSPLGLHRDQVKEDTAWRHFLLYTEK